MDRKIYKKIDKKRKKKVKELENLKNEWKWKVWCKRKDN